MPVNDENAVRAGRKALSIQEFGETFGISRSLVYKLITAGEIKTAKILSRTVITIGEVERFAASLEGAAE